MPRLSNLGRRFARLTFVVMAVIVAGVIGMIELAQREDRIATPETPPMPVEPAAPEHRPSTPQPAGAVATVLRPDGKPLAGATVIEFQAGGKLVVHDGVANVSGLSANRREDRTGPDGTFAIPQCDQPWFVFILGDDSYASANQESLEKSPTIRARPYARIHGRYLIGSRPVPNEELNLYGWTHDPTSLAAITFEQKATTDSQGRFTFDNVVPDAGPRVRRINRGNVGTIGEAVRVEPGATAEVTIGGKGRPVIGRVESPEGWAKPVDFTDESEVTLESNRKLFPLPSRFYRGKTSLGDDWSQWHRNWLVSPEGREYESHRFDTSVALGRDGSFRIDDVPPGEYRLAIGVNGRRKYSHYVGSYHDPRPFGRIIRIFTVPPIPGGRTDEPLDLGVLQLRPRSTPRLREPAPAFDVTTVDGKKLAVPGDFRGKFLLLEFGTMWDGWSSSQITVLNAVNQKFGADPRFTMLSLIFAADNPETRTYI